ncbi:MAG TPA: cupin [Candidatus Saccharimonadia bacterium]|nr:cupin [Candidatus Saccharimonadia bacterium]
MKHLDFLDMIDKGGFTTAGYAKRVVKPWGYEVHLTADGGPYMMKILHINKGCRVSLQAHDAKSESWVVHAGRAAVLLENAAGELEQIELEPGMGYTSQVGQRHRLVGLTDCEVFEASTPELGTTWRLEDDYARPDETEAMRAQPDRGWKV